MKYDFYSFLKKSKLDNFSYNKFKNDHNLYFLHSKRDKVWGNKPGDNRSLYFKHKDMVYNLCLEEIGNKLNIVEDDLKFLKFLNFTLTLTSSLYTASENNFYSIDNQFAKEIITGLPVFKGSSLKGALRSVAVDLIEDELIEKNYGEKFKNYESQDLASQDLASIEEKEERKDRFFFKKRKKLIQLFGSEKDINWFTFKSLLATGGIKDVNKIKEILNKINIAFENYLKKHKIINPDGFCRGRLIFEDIYFNKVGLDVITPLKRKERIPVHGPVYYEVVPDGTEAQGLIVWFPFDLIAKGISQDEIKKEWEEDKLIIENAFNRLSQIGIGAKIKNCWGRFVWEEI